MKFFKQIYLILILNIACSNSDNQLQQLSETQIIEFKQKLIRYIGKLPTEVSNEGKFHSSFDEYYAQEMTKYELNKYFKDKDGKIYFLFTKIAPSVKLKKVALGGYVVFDNQGNIQELEEVFRTWKHEPEKIKELSDMLFDKMIHNQDLSPYFPQNSGREEIIEFPNEYVYYDKQQKMWISTIPNPLEDYYKAKQERIDQVLTNKDTNP